MENSVVEILGQIATWFASIIAALWAFGKYMISRFDTKFDGEKKKREAMEVEMRIQVNEIKESYVRKDDFHRDVTEIKNRFNQVEQAITSRLDNLTTIMTQILMNRGQDK